MVNQTEYKSNNSERMSCIQNETQHDVSECSLKLTHLTRFTLWSEPIETDLLLDLPLDDLHDLD